jgi:hypothetical protein
VRLAIGEAECAAPGPTKHQPALDAEVLAQVFDVGDQVRGGIRARFAQGRGRARAALIEQHGPEEPGIEEAAMLGRRAAAGSTMQEEDRHAVRLAGRLPVHRMHGVERQHAAVVRFQRGMQDTSRIHRREV